MREEFSYLYSFSNPNELEFATTLLRANDIEFRVEDEFVTQTMNVLATGYAGGARLFVKNTEVEQAKILLADIGIDLRENPENQEFEFIKRLKLVAGKIPLLNRFPQIYQVPVLIALLVSILTVGIAFAIFPNDEERLVKEAWCIKQLFHSGENLQIETTGTRIVIIGGWGPRCEENISFSKENRVNPVSLPGLQSPNGRGEWELNNGKITISNVDEEAIRPVFQQSFSYKFTFSGKLELTSSTTKIVLYQ